METVCLDIVRAGDRDRYLAILCAPVEFRSYLSALYALDLELRSVTDRISDPLMGMLRFQWWRDSLTLSNFADGEKTGSPIVDELRALIHNTSFSAERLLAMIDTHQSDLDDLPFTSLDMLLTYLDRTFGSVVESACLILQQGKDWEFRSAARCAGRISGLIWLLTMLRSGTQRKKSYIPQDILMRYEGEGTATSNGGGSECFLSVTEEICGILEEYFSRFHRLCSNMDKEFSPAFAHIAAQRIRFDSLKSLQEAPSDPSPLRLQWRIWRFMWSRSL